MRNSWEKRDNDHSFLYHQSHHRSSQHFPLLLSRVWSFSFFSSIQSVIRLFTCRQTWTFDLDMASSLTRAGEQQIAGWVLQITVWLLLRYRYCRHCRGGTPAAESCWLGSNVAKKKKKKKERAAVAINFCRKPGTSLCAPTGPVQLEFSRAGPPALECLCACLQWCRFRHPGVHAAIGRHDQNSDSGSTSSLIELKDDTVIVVLGASGDLAKKKTVGDAVPPLCWLPIPSMQCSGEMAASWQIFSSPHSSAW